MLARVVRSAIRFRTPVLVVLLVLLASGVWAAKTLPIDALPDVSTIQVAALTKASGLTPTEVERTVTMPIENALNGIPGSVEQRSVSRPGLSAVTIIFRDDVDVWFARQLVLERLRGVELPPTASTPELSPVSSGLGEIFQFVVRSAQHSPMQLRTLLDWEILPQLRNVPGVIEVNTMGGKLKQFQVVTSRTRLQAFGLSLEQLISALRTANVNVGGGYVERREEAFTVRGQGMLTNTDDVGNVVIRTALGGTPVLVKNVAEVVVGPALRQGVITRDGKDEAVTGIVMMLLGENSRDVVRDVGVRIREIQKSLPSGVRIDVVYDRAEFVGRTITTVAENLTEGMLIVGVVLTLLLGSVRAAFAVVLGIPVAMSVGLLGMHLFNVTGDLMSLGAIDFGFLVDGPIVMVEAVMAATAGQRINGALRSRSYAQVVGQVARPVAFAVAIIMLVYLPLLALQGIEGKMFRPMAITMACALFGALVYSVLFFPAVLTFVPPSAGHGPRWVTAFTQHYARTLPRALRQRYPLMVGSVALLGGTGAVFAAAGAEFVPRIFEGDAVVTIRRAPSISLTQAQKLDLRTEQVLHRFPEVITTVAQTGRAEVAVDPVGYDNTDILTRLKPLEDWTTTNDFDDLSVFFKNRIENSVPGTFVSVSQPIEDKTNELISGSRADVQIEIYGPDLGTLARYAQRIGNRVKRIAGTGDVRVERILGAPLISAIANRERMARYGVKVEEAFTVLQAAREGVKVGEIYEDERKFELRVLQPPDAPTAGALGDLFVPSSTGESVPLREVVRLSEGEGPTAIRRDNRRRAARVDVNLRGRDLVSWVAEARRAVESDLELPSTYQVQWGGQFENFERARARLAIVVPIVVAIIFGMLLWMFGNLRFALAVFTLVPLSLSGGMLGLILRHLSFSLPAAVGFIALGGIGVLNGVVMASEVRRRLHQGEALDQAVRSGATAVFRAVLTTAAVAGLGFLPMALARSSGAEIQRPLATVVVVGMLLGALLTVFVFPCVLKTALRGYQPRLEQALDHDIMDNEVDLGPAAAEIAGSSAGA